MKRTHGVQRRGQSFEKAIVTPTTDKRIGGIEMRRHMRTLPVFLAAVVALLVTAPKVWAIPFAETAIFFEFNSTDLDLGIHIFFDATGWEEVEVTGPDGTIFEVENDGSLREIGSTEVFTESAEPPLCAAEECEEGELEAAIDAFLAMFPEGKYSFEGTTVEGKKLSGMAELSHDLPVAVSLDLDDFSTDDIILWTDNSEAGDPEIVGYQAVYEFLEQGGDKRVFVFSVDLPATATMVTVPPNFLSVLPNCSEAKVEVLAIGADGNKTITEEEVDCP